MTPILMLVRRPVGMCEGWLCGGFMKKKSMLVFFMLPVLLMSGCSYLVNGVNDKISINSNDRSTQIYLNGQPYAKGFAIVPLRRGEAYSISGKLPGCKDAVYEAKWKLNSLAALSFITLPVDLALGTAWEVSPNSIMLNPACD